MPSINNTQLGEYVKKTIDKYDWTIRQAALNIGVYPAYLSKLINKKADSNPKRKHGNPEPSTQSSEIIV